MLLIICDTEDLLPADSMPGSFYAITQINLQTIQFGLVSQYIKKKKKLDLREVTTWSQNF